MRITVLGATGMAGTAVVNEALSRGHEVTAVSDGVAIGLAPASPRACWTSPTSRAWPVS